MAKNTKLELHYLVPAAYRGRLVYGKDFAASDNLEPWEAQAIKDRLEDCQELRGYFVDVLHNIAPSRGTRPFKTVIQVTPAKKRNPYSPDMLVHAGHAIQQVGGRYAVQPYGRDFATLPAAKAWIERHVAREMREPTRNPGPRGEPDIATLLGWPGYSAFGRAIYKHPSRAGISVQQKPSGFILHVGGDHFGPYKTAKEAIRRFEEGLFAPGSGGATTPEFERYLKGGPAVKNPRGFKSFVVDFDVRGGADTKRAVQTIISRWMGKKKVAHAGYLSAAFASEDDAKHALTAAAGQGIPASGFEKPGLRQLAAYPQRKKNPLGGPLTITHEGDALIIKHIGNPKKRPINVRSATSARSEVRHLVTHDFTCPYPPEIGKAEPTPEGWLVRVTFRKAKWGKQTGFGPEFDRWYEARKNSTALVGSGPDKPSRFA